MFEINGSSGFNYTKYTMVYDYGPLEYTINDESTLLLYKCDNISSCTLADTGATVNTTANTITATLTGLSVFMVAEDSTTTVTTTSSGGGGGGSTRVVYRSLQLLVPGTVELSLADNVVVPIQVVNPEDVAMNGIGLNAVPNTEDLSALWQTETIDTLDAGANETVLLYLESHSKPGEYDVDITATVTSPKVQETAKLYVRLVEAIGKETLVERIVLAQDMFRENPECLELNDLLKDAEVRIEAGDIEGGKERVGLAISKCKDLIAGKESPLIYERVKEWKNPILIVMGLVVVALIVVMLIRKPKFNFYKKSDKGSGGKGGGWFGFGGGKKKSSSSRGSGGRRGKKSVWG